MTRMAADLRGSDTRQIWFLSDPRRSAAIRVIRVIRVPLLRVPVAHATGLAVALAFVSPTRPRPTLRSAEPSRRG